MKALFKLALFLALCDWLIVLGIHSAALPFFVTVAILMILLGFYISADRIWSEIKFFYKIIPNWFKAVCAFGLVAEKFVVWGIILLLLPHLDFVHHLVLGTAGLLTFNCLVMLVSRPFFYRRIRRRPKTR